MPILKNRPPSCRLHKVSGQAVVTSCGRDKYLGRHGTPESLARYRKVVAEWAAQSSTASADECHAMARMDARVFRRTQEDKELLRTSHQFRTGTHQFKLPCHGRVVAIRQVGGLHHWYRRPAQFQHAAVSTLVVLRASYARTCETKVFVQKNGFGFAREGARAMTGSCRLAIEGRHSVVG